MKHARVKLAQHLRDLVRGVEVRGDVLLGEGHGRVRPVNPAARGSIDETLHSDGMGLFENLQRPKSVYLKVELRMVDGVLVGEVSGQVVDDLRSLLERATQILVAGAVALQKGDCGA